MYFCPTEHARYGLKPPVSVLLSRNCQAIQLYTYVAGFFGSAGKYEFNIPMDPDMYAKAQFKVFLQTAEGWFAAPGVDPGGTVYYRIYTAYAAGWARIFVLPLASDSLSEWTVSVKVLTLSMDAAPSDLDYRNYHQVCALFRTKKLAENSKIM
ncbi:hypothetical protein [Lunatimonas salinarum]|uniref:hypothetical protein n=1 Tax=Lunatimonas salinarum TaxID=1774590 RepID=UPI001AE03532|nr:hypothetical protein [Lunatimonas salinarum]